MTKKIAKFPVVHARRGAPANDNHPRLHEARQLQPRLACRWSIDATGRLACHWEAEGPDDPQPSRRSQASEDIHKTVFELSYQVRVVAQALCLAACGQRRRRSP
jgi:hypothetical protein